MRHTVFSVEETKVLAANLPKPTSQSQDRLRLAFSDGHVREVNLTSQLGRLAPLPQRTARQMYAEHESRAGPSPCEINKDGWLTYRRSSGDEVIKVAQVFIPGKTKYGTPQAACDAEGSRIYVCVGLRLSQVEKTETGYKELPLNQHCNNVGASDLRNYIWVDLGNTACLFPVARPVFDKWHCSERVTRFYVSESKKVLAGFEYGMEPELRLFDYDGFVNRTAVLDDLMYTGFVVSGEKAFAASSEDITVVPSPHSLESAQADVIAYHPFRNREKLISIAKQLVNELPQLTEEQRRRSGIELPN